MAAIREFKEETGEVLKSWEVDQLGILKTKNRKLHVFLSTVSIDFKFLNLNKMEHSEAKWFLFDKIPEKVNPPTKKILEWIK